MAVLVVLIGGYFAISALVRPAAGISAAEEARMMAAYDRWRRASDSMAAGQMPQLMPESGALFAFDPNTLDSEGFIRLGMPVRAVKGLLRWRAAGKHFYQAEDLKPLYNLPEEVYARLAPFVQIADNRGLVGLSDRKGPGYAWGPIPDVIDLNRADSALLDRGLPGIGATLTHRIIQRRAALGGFVSAAQLLEVYKFEDTTFRKLEAKLKIDPASVRKLSLNTATLEQLSAHPYVGEKMAKNIILYRDGIKQYERISQLRQVPLMNEEIYRKIAPYFKVE